MKPKYSIRKNFYYPIEGLMVLARESAFKIEISVIIVLLVSLIFLPVVLWVKAVMALSLFFPLMAEAFNTAIEKVVDLVTEDYHILAKEAKDIAAFGVMLSIFFSASVWGCLLYYFYQG